MNKCSPIENLKKLSIQHLFSVIEKKSGPYVLSGGPMQKEG